MLMNEDKMKIMFIGNRKKLKDIHTSNIIRGFIDMALSLAVSDVDVRLYSEFSMEKI